MMLCFVLENFNKGQSMTQEEEHFSNPQEDKPGPNEEPRGNKAIDKDSEDDEDAPEEPQVRHKDVIDLNLWTPYRPPV